MDYSYLSRWHLDSVQPLVLCPQHRHSQDGPVFLYTSLSLILYGPLCGLAFSLSSVVLWSPALAYSPFLA